jgi:hypothetical protein
MMGARYTVSTLAAAMMAFALTAPAAHGQTILGVRGGVSGASIEVDNLGDIVDDGNRTGFTGGLFLDFGGDDILGFQVGASYTQKGAELDLGDAIEELSLNYLEIPAVVKVGLPLGNLKPSVFGGVGLGLNVSCESGLQDCRNDISGTEWSGIFGADVAFYLDRFAFFVDGRYHYGLNDVSDIPDGAAFGELKNRSWTFQAGVGMPFGN